MPTISSLVTYSRGNVSTDFMKTNTCKKLRPRQSSQGFLDKEFEKKKKKMHQK